MEIPEPTNVFEVEKGKTHANLAAPEEYKEYLAKLVEADDGFSAEDAAASLQNATADLDLHDETRLAKAVENEHTKADREQKRESERRKAQIAEATWPRSGSGTVGPCKLNVRNNPLGGGRRLCADKNAVANLIVAGKHKPADTVGMGK